jgi:KaiC/GvpD/RAD55 family RecA-like ATPase
MGFRKADRKKARAKISVIGASGSGKTYSSILIAMGLGNRVAMIDTEQGSGELYSHLGDYQYMRINAPYTPNKLIDAIKEAEKEGYDVLIIDSLSPFWSGEGGLLEIKSSIEKRGKNSFAAWAEVTPLYNRVMETIITSDLHVVATMRTKTEYMVENAPDRFKVTKIGTAPVLRDGAEYEFTIVFTLDPTHTASVSKDRTGIFDNMIFVPSKKTGEQIRSWLDSGSSVVEEIRESQTVRNDSMTHAETRGEEIKNIPSEPKVNRVEGTVPEGQADW